jgi:hypothetical protein
VVARHGDYVNALGHGRGRGPFQEEAVTVKFLHHHLEEAHVLVLYPYSPFPPSADPVLVRTGTDCGTAPVLVLVLAVDPDTKSRDSKKGDVNENGNEISGSEREEEEGADRSSYVPRGGCWRWVGCDESASGSESGNEKDGKISVVPSVGCPGPCPCRGGGKGGEEAVRRKTSFVSRTGEVENGRLLALDGRGSIQLPSGRGRGRDHGQSPLRRKVDRTNPCLYLFLFLGHANENGE